MVLFPLKALGEEGWKIAAALTARHIGGAVNYMVCVGEEGRYCSSEPFLAPPHSLIRQHDAAVSWAHYHTHSLCACKREFTRGQEGKLFQWLCC